MDNLNTDQKNIARDVLGLVKLMHAGDQQASTELLGSLIVNENAADVLTSVLAHLLQMTRTLATVTEQSVNELVDGILSNLPASSAESKPDGSSSDS